MDQVEQGRREQGNAATEAGDAPAGPEVRQRAVRGARTTGPALWPVGLCRGRHAEGAAGLAEGPVAALPLLGVERRLVRRAEAVWEQLRPPAGVPPAGAIHALNSPVFAGNAVLFALPPHPSEPDCTSLRILRIGQNLAELGVVGIGPVRAQSGAGAGVAGRLAALVARACAKREPVVVEIDAPGRDRPGILLRAIALPFAAPVGVAQPSGPLAVVVASWRTLLSAAETENLQRELAAALEWLRGTH
jgi:hypothetical protein